MSPKVPTSGAISMSKTSYRSFCLFSDTPSKSKTRTGRKDHKRGLTISISRRQENILGEISLQKSDGQCTNEVRVCLLVMVTRALYVDGWSNSRAYSTRLKALGWIPREKSIKDTVDGDVDFLVKMFTQKV
ncbi:hypothetical protein FRC08_013763 [Ceratobasidium sp. 394]|nr:hypothetical protein FRC08_013763 [Ceratobasidium sp. 394]